MASCVHMCSRSNIYIHIQDGIRHILMSLLHEFKIATDGCVVTVVKRNKHLHVGDFQVPARVFGKTETVLREQIIASLIKEAKSQNIPIAKASFREDGNLYISLDRGATYREVLQQVSHRGVNYGKQLETSSDKCSISESYVLLNNADAFNLNISGEVQIGNIRSALLLEYVHNLLEATGHKVRDISQPPHTSLQKELQRYGISSSLERSEKHCETRHNDKLQRLKCSKYTKEPAADYSLKLTATSLKPSQDTTQTTATSGGEKQNNVYIDVLGYLKNHDLLIGKGGYEKGLTPVPVLLNCDYTPKFLQASLLSENTQDNESAARCIHVVSKAKFFSQQQVDVLWRMLSPSPLNQEHLVFGPVITNSASDENGLSAEQFFSLRKDQMKNAFIVKYGDEVSGSGWDRTIIAMTQAVVKFELLSIIYKNQVKLELNQNSELGGPVDDKGGTFVMYNCSRLATLFQHYNEKVQQGIYDCLEDVENVDFTLLREEDEWSLLFNYILHYPSVVKDSVSIGESIHSQIKTHKICSFLSDLSRDLSTYYRKVRILREARQHLQPLMFARLHLLKSLQQVLHNALSLLNISPPTQM